MKELGNELHKEFKLVETAQRGAETREERSNTIKGLSKGTDENVWRLVKEILVSV